MIFDVRLKEPSLRFSLSRGETIFRKNPLLHHLPHLPPRLLRPYSLFSCRTAPVVVSPCWGVSSGALLSLVLCVDRFTWKSLDRVFADMEFVLVPRRPVTLDYSDMSVFNSYKVVVKHPGWLTTFLSSWERGFKPVTHSRVFEPF